MGTEEEKAGDGGQWGDEGDLGEEVEEEVEKKKTKGMCAKLMKFFASLGGEHRGRVVEHKTCDILAAERLRLMRFDNRLIIDSFQS